MPTIQIPIQAAGNKEEKSVHRKNPRSSHRGGQTNPYKAIHPRQQRFQPSISMDTWEAHISRITCAKKSRPSIRPPDKRKSLVRTTEEEVIRATKEAGRNRAPGPDEIRN
jgi:hypothetical protein